MLSLSSKNYNAHLADDENDQILPFWSASCPSDRPVPTPALTIPTQYSPSAKALNPKINSAKIFSPIHRVPIELLGEIFDQYLRMPYERGSPPLRSSRICGSNPIILSHVCTTWRAISISMPILWSSIYISKPKASYLPTIRLWLERAAGCPLSLSLSQSYNAGVTEQTATEQTLSLFITKIPQWRHIELLFSGDAKYEALMSLSMDAARMLESAHITTTFWGQGIADHLWQKIYRLLTIRRIRWDYAYLSNGIPKHAPWTQLTHITGFQVHKAKLVDFLEILRGCEQLVDLDLSEGVPSDQVSGQAQPVLLPNLRVLAIATRSQDSTPLISKLILPSLVSLETYNYCYPLPLSIACVQDLLVRSACRLEIFRFRDRHAQEHDVLDFLASPPCQSLTELELLCPVTDRIVNFLTLSRDRMTPFLSYLERFRLPETMFDL
ncbi:hypothetical protein Hypma_008615 [Hypsizygus marmoreus]|uniref:F-box domain-containing protein n=1 Tax=Hypsizygus marmoreus TaxID=39966 RepID=A0A369JPK4_HYPMA|nr:hypothetical protein Hypma_008615 [Hypsizygus marmoreus]